MIKVIIVDDEYLVRYGLIETIEWNKYGFEVAGQASNGKEGLKIAMECNPDIIITDIRMPFMDGIEFMRSLRENNVNTKIIVMSGYEEFSYAKGAVDYGASSYILKPIENEKLIDILQKTAETINKEKMTQTVLKSKLISDFIKVLEIINIDKKSKLHREVELAKEYINEHYYEDITINSIAENLYISPYYLMHVFKENQGITINDYITDYRIKKAKQLLKDNRYKIYHVCEMVGYKDPRYFSQIFKKNTGFTPKEYIKQSTFNDNSEGESVILYSSGNYLDK